jgi:hypothetical protein
MPLLQVMLQILHTTLKVAMFVDSKIPKLFVASSLLVAIAGCGGGSGGSGSETSQPLEPSLSIGDAKTVEGNSGSKQLEFVVTLTNGGGNGFDVDFSTSAGSAISTEDYESSSGTLTFVGNTQESKKISITIYGDTDYSDSDPTETFSVALNNSNLTGKMEAVGIIENDDMTKSETYSQLRDSITSEYQDRVNEEFNTFYTFFSLDLNNDNDEDVVALFTGTYDPNTTLSTPEALAYFTNNRGQGFEKTVSNINAFSRFHEVADVNNDGLDDLILVADHIRRVVNGEEFRESKPWLLIQTEQGDLIDASNQVEEIYGDWHGLESVDIDSDGDLDFIGSALHTGLYGFINDGTGNFSINQNMLPLEELGNFTSASAPFYTNIHSIDLGQDGLNEIILGSEEANWRYSDNYPRLPILVNNASTYKFDQAEDTLDVFYTESEIDDIQVVVDMETIDLNLDSCKDLVVYQTDYYNNHTLSVFKGDCNGSLTLVFEDTRDGMWRGVVKIADVNEDGLEDVYMIMTGDLRAVTEASNVVWFNNGDNTFRKTDYNKEYSVDLVSWLYFHR